MGLNMRKKLTHWTWHYRADWTNALQEWEGSIFEGDGDNVRANAGLLDDSSDNEELVQNGAAGPGAEIGNGLGGDAIDLIAAELGQNLFPHDGKCRRSRKCHECISSAGELNGETRTQRVHKLTSQVGMFLF